MVNVKLEAWAKTFEVLIEQHEATRGMYVHARRGRIYLGRCEPLWNDPEETEDDDRIHLTPLKDGLTFGLSVKHHSGRYNKTPFEGTLEELTETIATVMAHVVAPFG